MNQFFPTLGPLNPSLHILESKQRCHNTFFCYRLTFHQVEADNAFISRYVTDIYNVNGYYVQMQDKTKHV